MGWQPMPRHLPFLPNGSSHTEGDREHAVEEQDGRNRDQPDPEARVTAVGNDSAKNEAEREQNARPHQRDADAWPIIEVLKVARGKSGRDIHHREGGAMGVPQRKHETSNVVPHIHVPADLEPVKALEDAA